MYNNRNNPQFNDQVIASDLLNTVKTSVTQTATALTEAVTPDVHRTLEQHLTQGLRFHQQVTDFMVQRGWYQPYNVQQMITSDIQQAQHVHNMSQNPQNQSYQNYRP